jgi:hypothetical protein
MALSIVLSAITLFAVGGILIRLLNLNLPPPQSVKELILQTFWIYPNVDRRKLLQNRIAWFLVVFVSYLTISAIFF